MANTVAAVTAKTSSERIACFIADLLPSPSYRNAAASPLRPILPRRTPARQPGWARYCLILKRVLKAVELPLKQRKATPDSRTFCGHLTAKRCFPVRSHDRQPRLFPWTEGFSVAGLCRRLQLLPHFESVR